MHDGSQNTVNIKQKTFATKNHIKNVYQGSVKNVFFHGNCLHDSRRECRGIHSDSCEIHINAKVELISLIESFEIAVQCRSHVNNAIVEILMPFDYKYQNPTGFDCLMLIRGIVVFTPLGIKNFK